MMFDLRSSLLSSSELSPFLFSPLSIQCRNEAGGKLRLLETDLGRDKPACVSFDEVVDDSRTIYTGNVKVVVWCEEIELVLDKPDRISRYILFKR